MPVKYAVTITSIGTSSFIVIPKPVIDGFNLRKGQRLDLIVNDDGIRIPLLDQTNTDGKEFPTPLEKGDISKH
jgi:AbrB family looped-hinge helix DNA binding protein